MDKYDIKIINARLAENEEKMVGDRYYRNETDILSTGAKPKGNQVTRLADNRLSSNIYQALVQEKISYLFSYPILVDIDGNKELNEKLSDVLDNNKFDTKIGELGTTSSNFGKSWVHYWIDGEGNFKFAEVPAKQIVDIYSEDLERKLIKVYRTYTITNPEDRTKTNTVVEEWTDTEFIRYTYEKGIKEEADKTEKFTHTLARVPFISFCNNDIAQSDLAKAKSLIDAYDKINSGFVNDLEDIQQAIMLLRGYGGEDLEDFMNDLKSYKVISLDEDGDASNMSIEIPVEARKTMLELLKKQIIEVSPGLSQDSKLYASASGTALKFYYRALELKAAAMELQFRVGLTDLVKAILDYYHIQYNKINFTFTRNMINNDSELATMCLQSEGTLSKSTILANHPLVDDVEDEIEKLKKEQEENASLFNSYSSFGNTEPDGDVNDE